MRLQPSLPRPSAGQRRTSADEYLFSSMHDQTHRRRSLDSYSSAELYTTDFDPPPPYQASGDGSSGVPLTAEALADRMTMSIRFGGPRGPRRPLAAQQSPRVPDVPLTPCSNHALSPRTGGAQMERRPSYDRLLSVLARALRSSEPAQRPNKLHKPRPAPVEVPRHAAVEEVYTAVTHHPFREPLVSHPPLSNASRNPRNLYQFYETEHEAQSQRLSRRSYDGSPQDFNPESSSSTVASPSNRPSNQEMKYCHKCPYRFFNSSLLDLHLLLIHGPPTDRHLQNNNQFSTSCGRFYYT